MIPLISLRFWSVFLFAVFYALHLILNSYKKWLDKNKMQNNDGDDNEPFRSKRTLYNKQGSERRFRFQSE